MNNKTNNILVVDDSSCAINYSRSEILSEHNAVNSIDDLLEFFNDDPEIIFHIDAKKYLSLITGDNEEIPLNGYKSSQCPVFIKLSTPELSAGDNDILLMIPFNHWCSDAMPWQMENMQIDDRIPKTGERTYGEAENYVKADYNGFEHSEYIYEKSKGKVYCCAIMYCHDLKYRIANDNIIYQPYVPAYGQLCIFKKYWKMLNYICEYIAETEKAANLVNRNITSLHYGDYINDAASVFSATAAFSESRWEYWSSSEFDEKYIWYLTESWIAYVAKDNCYRVLPFFKKIVNE